MRQQVRKNIVAVLVVCRGWRTRIPADHNFKRRIRRVAGEVFVGINVEVGRMIYGNDFDLIQIHGFFKRFHEAKAELAIFFSNGLAINLDVLGWPRNIALAGPDPVSDNSRTEHVPDQLVTCAVPNKKGGAGTSATVDLHELLFAIGGDFDFVLQDARRPEHADDISLGRLSEANRQVRRILSEITRRSRDLELLPSSSREDLDFGSDGALVIGKPFQIEAQPVVLVAAFISQQDSRTMILRDEQVGSAIVIVVASDDGARIFELNLVEADVDGDIFESVQPEIAEQTYFATTVGSFTDSDQVDPAVVVVVDGRDAPRPNPVCGWKLNSLESLALLIAPERQSRRTRLTEGNVHPSVVIKIENCDSRSFGRYGRRPEGTFNEFAFPRVFINQGSQQTLTRCSTTHPCHDNVDRAIIVVIGTDSRMIRRAPLKSH